MLCIKAVLEDEPPPLYRPLPPIMPSLVQPIVSFHAPTVPKVVIDQGLHGHPHLMKKDVNI